MKKYLGSRMTAYAAVICPLLVIAPLLFAIVALCSEISTATLLLAVLCCSCSVIYIIYIQKEALQLYAWGVFEETAVRVRCFLRNDFALDYEKCLGVGIEHYNHNAIHTNIGSKVFFIYLSYDYMKRNTVEKLIFGNQTREELRCSLIKICTNTYFQFCPKSRL